MFSRVMRSDEGASFIEFAVVLPMLALLVIGLIETGRYMAYAVRLGNAAHAGVQFAAQGETTAENDAIVASAACNDSSFSCTTATPRPGHTASPDTMLVTSSVSCSIATTPCPPGDLFVVVQTSGSFRTLLGYPIFRGSNTLTMTAQARQQVNP